MSVENVKAYFRKYGIEEKIQEFEVSSATVELAAAALCRGLDKPGHHTCMEPVCFRWFDYVFMMVATIWLFVMCALWIRGYAV